TDRDNNYTKDDHFWSAESLWQGSSSVAYDDNNYAKSSVGFDSHGNLEAKIGVSVNNSINRVYSSSYYRDDGFQCEGTVCGTAVPLGGNFEMQLKQNGSFTVGSPNYSLTYYMRTASTAYNFHFAVQQGEGPLAPYGWFSTENLVTGALTQKDMESDTSFFNLIWEDNNDDGIYNFSYDFSFGGSTNGVDFGEELNIFSYANASGSENQFFDSYNSFYANIISPDDGVSFYRGNQLLGNTVVTPEPISVSLFLLGGGLMAMRRYRRKK
ncbi:MAG: PEP-CTERM sorting domain-containing protein, partial [Akkermansiaceae bacterium]|nr:PEP-CTERM sorting domain-containing protein [Akkermansiaceae bacterium]